MKEAKDTNANNSNLSKFFSDNSLSTSISKVIILVLSICFIILIVLAGAITGFSLNNATYGTAQDSANSTANQLQSIIDNIAVDAGDIEAYLGKYYDMKSKGYTNMSGEKNTSQNVPTKKSTVYDTYLPEIISDAEKYMTTRAYNSVKYDPTVVSFGVLLEPYALDKSIKQYSFYVDPTEGNKDISLHPFEFAGCDSYDWYKWVKELKATFSDPYPNSNGDMIISYMKAIEYNNEFKGIAAVDINASYFNNIAVDNKKYSSMFTTAINQNQVVVFHTKNSKHIKKKSKRFI